MNITLSNYALDGNDYGTWINADATVTLDSGETMSGGVSLAHDFGRWMPTGDRDFWLDPMFATALKDANSDDDLIVELHDALRHGNIIDQQACDALAA